MAAEFLFGLPGKVATLLTRITSARATKLDNLDAAISTVSVAATALSTSNWTNARAALIDNCDATLSTEFATVASDIAAIPGSLKSVQRGTSTAISSNTTTNATITAVDLAKSFLIFSENSSNGNLQSQHEGSITTTTNIRFTRKATSSGNDSISWFVVEFN